MKMIKHSTKTGYKRRMTTCMAGNNQRSQNNELGMPKHPFVYEILKISFCHRISSRKVRYERTLWPRKLLIYWLFLTKKYWFIAYLMKSNFELIDGKIQPHTNKIKINVFIRIIPKPIYVFINQSWIALVPIWMVLCFKMLDM